MKKAGTPLRLVRIDTKCPSCGKDWAIILTKKDLKTLLKQLKTTPSGTIPTEAKNIECT